MRIQAAGLYDFQWKRNTADPSRCLDEAQDLQRPSAKPSLLTLGQMSGAFFVLVIGCIASFLVFFLRRFIFLVELNLFPTTAKIKYFFLCIFLNY